MQVSRKVKMIIAGAVILPIFLFFTYAWIALTYSFSAGDRDDYMQKLSKRG